jgi:hypothetical protein
MPKELIEEISPTDSVNVFHLSTKEIEALKRARWRARTDFFYLANVILGKDLICPEFNGPLVKRLQQFTPPNEQQYNENDRWTSDGWIYKPIYDKPTQLPGKRRTLIIDFRSSLKTTCNCECHSIQWVLNFPLVCIAIFQYKLEKAESILSSIKQHFLFNSRFRALFPEYCPPPDKLKDFGTKSKFSLYNINQLRKTARREDTFMTAALEAGLAGYHFEVMKFSDIVDPENSENVDQCVKTIHKFGQSLNLLVSPSYWVDVEGTRYHFEDLYGKIIRDWKQDVADKGGPEHTIWNIYTRGIFKPDIPEDEVQFLPHELEVEDKLVNGKRVPYDFPDRLNEKRFPLEELEFYEKSDPTNFHAQMKNVPYGGRGGLLDFKLVTDKATGKMDVINIISGADYDKFPKAYTVLSVDPAETTNERSNYTAMIFAGIDRDGRTYVEQIIHGKWDPTGVTDKILWACDKLTPDVLLMEEVSATRNMLPGIRREWERFPHRHHQPVVKFNKRDKGISKEEKIRLMLHHPYHMGNLRFVKERILPNGYENLVLEMHQFPRGGHDDILDALSEIYAARDWFGEEFARRLPQRPRFIKYTPELQARLIQQKVFGEDFDADTRQENSNVMVLTPSNFSDYLKKVGGL